VHCGSETVDRSASGQPADAAGAGQTLDVHSPHGSTFLREVTSWPPLYQKIIQPMCIKVGLFTWKTFPPNFTRFDLKRWSLIGFLKRSLQQQQQQQHLQQQQEQEQDE